MLLAALLTLQATPEGVAERDARELAGMLDGRWNNTETVAFAAETGAVVRAEGVRFVARKDGLLDVFWRDGAKETTGTLRIEAESTEGDADPARPYELRAIYTDERGPCPILIERVGEAYWTVSRTRPCGPLGGGALVTEAALTVGNVLFYRADPYTCWISRKKDEGGEDAWTEPDAARIAINLRWVQASCTRDQGTEP